MNFFTKIFKKIPFVGKKQVDRVADKPAKYITIKGRKIKVK